MTSFSLLIAVVILSALSGLLFFVMFLLLRRLDQWETMWEMLQDDLEINVDFFDHVTAQPVFQNNEAVKALSHNVTLIRDRLEIYAEAARAGEPVEMPVYNMKRKEESSSRRAPVAE